MKSVSYTKARNSLANLMSEVCDSHSPVIITRTNQNCVVMLSLEDFESFQETAYLLKSPRNAERLLKAVEDIAEGKNFHEREIY
jgi:antitoxin YefM